MYLVFQVTENDWGQYTSFTGLSQHVLSSCLCPERRSPQSQPRWALDGLQRSRSEMVGCRPWLSPRPRSLVAMTSLCLSAPCLMPFHLPPTTITLHRRLVTRLFVPTGDVTADFPSDETDHAEEPWVFLKATTASSEVEKRMYCVPLLKEIGPSNMLKLCCYHLFLMKTIKYIIYVSKLWSMHKELKQCLPTIEFSLKDL